jgi:biopolymer transport protein TolQ
VKTGIATDLSLWGLISNASLLVQIVMVILIVVSLQSWWYIFMKMFTLRRALKQTDEFERNFWSGSDLTELYRGASQPSGSMEKIFEAGFREFIKLKQQPNMELSVAMDGVRRAMRATYQREMDFLESHLSFLASVGSVSPYIGLFGTVWGIMHAFRGLANVVQATLAAVAPGIAEALVATAMGLFAAIPAVIAYNRYAYDINRIATRFESFMEEFSNILQRQAGR